MDAIQQCRQVDRKLADIGQAVFMDAFDFIRVSPPLKGSGGGFGLVFSKGNRGFRAVSGPDPLENLICSFILAVSAAELALPRLDRVWMRSSSAVKLTANSLTILGRDSGCFAQSIPLSF